MIEIGKIDKNLVTAPLKVRDDAAFYDIRKPPFKIFGVYDSTVCPFWRMPVSVSDKVSHNYTIMNGMLPSVRARFRTDSPYIKINVETPSVTPYTINGTLVAMKGFDVYIKDKAGVERYYGSLRLPVSFENGYEAELDLPDGMKDITLYFPMYNQIGKLLVALSKDAALLPGSSYKNNKPMLFYGSSITHGCCVTRTGNVYPSIISRHLDTDVINLGASGSAKGQLDTAEFIGKQELCAFVYDYDHNAPDAAFLKNTHEPFFRTVRKLNPTLPILMITGPNTIGYDETTRLERLEVIRKTYENAVNEGDKHVYFLDGTTLFPKEDADVCWADQTHPNDYGYLCMAKGIEKIIKIMWQESE